MDDNQPLREHTLSLSTNASHEDEIVLFPPQGITSSASRPEIPRQNFFKFLESAWPTGQGV